MNAKLIRPEDLPSEFDLRACGYVMRGWGFSRKQMAASINAGQMLNPTFEGMINYCPWNCNYCYTQRDSDPDAKKRRLANELSLADRLRIIQEAAQLGAKSMNFVGAGEPTLDPDFWQIVEYTAESGLIPIVFTEASFRLTEKPFAQRLYDLGATVVIKVNSLWNRKYQNAMVTGNRPVCSEYFDRRNRAIKICREIGFADCTPTRLGFDTVVTRDNYYEIPRLHRHARENNIFIVLKNFLRTGRVKEKRLDAMSQVELAKLWEELAKIDADEFGLKHASVFPFGGCTPCSLRSTGLHIAIDGQVFRCDGEDKAIGNLRQESLEQVWRRVRHIGQNIKGLCPPRKRVF